MNVLLGFHGLVSYILLAIVLGIVIRNTVGLPALFQPGVNFSLKKLLRLGIILLGIRLNFSDVIIIGFWGIPIVIGCIITGLLVTIWLTQFLRLSKRLGTLIAVGTSICGATAIVAAAPTIEASDEEIAYAIANITVFGIIAMFTYPYIAHLVFSGNLVQVGLFIGTAIHETAQVAGAGLMYDQTLGISLSPSGSDVALVTKLVRNLMMVGVIPIMAILYARNAVEHTLTTTTRPSFLRLIPLFLFGFLAMAITRSIGDLGLHKNMMAFGIFDNNEWSALIANIHEVSGYLLANAMAGVGLGVSISVFKGLGIRPFGVGLVSAFMVGLTSLVFVYLLGPLVSI